jgi:two-component system, NarL family, response regulator NreC
MSGIRVVVADDHAILREGLTALLQAAPDIEVVGGASNGEQAIEICERLRPDVVLMDAAMPGLGGLEATLTIKQRHSAIHVVVLTQHENPEYVRRFLKAGASGYILKKSAGADLAGAIRAVMHGGLVLDPAIARTALEASAPTPAADAPYETLTTREKQVLKLVAEGRSNKEVAGLLDISVKTAMTHREHLMQKLGVHNRTDLVRFAIRAGVIQ